MNQRGWDRFLTDTDREIFANSGFGVRMGFGSRPALIVIDVAVRFCGEERQSVLESVAKWRTSCGEAAWDALPYIEVLIGAARQRGIPVIYTKAATPRDDSWDKGLWAAKNSRGKEEAVKGGDDIMPQITPAKQDIVISKYKPSAFFGTTLDSYLVQLGVDSLILVGTTTSGCIRGTVLDAFSRNYKTAVVEEATFDRGEASHWMSLFDIEQKYADVVKTDEVLGFFDLLPSDLFAGRLPETADQYPSTTADTTSGPSNR